MKELNDTYLRSLSESDLTVYSDKDLNQIHQNLDNQINRINDALIEQDNFRDTSGLSKPYIAYLVTLKAIAFNLQSTILEVLNSRKSNQK